MGPDDVLASGKAMNPEGLGEGRVNVSPIFSSTRIPHRARGTVDVSLGTMERSMFAGGTRDTQLEESKILAFETHRRPDGDRVEIRQNDIMDSGTP